MTEFHFYFYFTEKLIDFYIVTLNDHPICQFKSFYLFSYTSHSF